MPQDDLALIRRKLTPRGSLRAAINMSNTLLVSGRDGDGAPIGLAPSMARALATQLATPIDLVAFATPGAIADAAHSDVWDVALIGAEHAREGLTDFTPAYALIDATYLVRASSGLTSVADVDAAGVRIAAPRRTAYGLWLERNLTRATLVSADGLAAARDLFARREADALAGLRPWLATDAEGHPGALVLPGHFTAVEQSILFQAGDRDVADYLTRFVEDAKSAGLVAQLIARLGVRGVTAAS